MLDVSGGRGGGSDLERGVGALKRFQTRVNGLLKDFEGGAGGSANVAAQRISRGSLSGGNAPFTEADGLFSQYNRVHEELVTLSKSLGDQIELLSIAVHGAEVGFDNLEEDLRRRFHSIQARLDQEHDRQQERREQQKDAKSETPRNEETGGTHDLGDS
ncbi:hypothetical protein [Streptomyces sp. H27-C3]|uniref:hypothetical protein n=1 Tax=Streptomyces sp. H27-C3 TaxID=3046305 RepID=UPI0024B95846|nr:hypothetical protein [Streptomyces sp. H27-C3]MDJ0460984.1 hypothetical protein [Streptomyces sp. H27-C3]